MPLQGRLLRVPVHLDNPAGRLYGLLTGLAEQGRETAIIDGWAAVLGVPQDDVALHLGEVAEQIRQIQSAADRVGVDALRPTVERYREDWEAPIFSRQHALNAALKHVLPGPAALEALDMVSAHLHVVAPEGEVPDETKLEDLKSQLRAVIDAVQKAEDITPEMRRLLIERLHGVEEAIEHLDIGGPQAIRLAAEAAYGGATAEADASLWDSQTFKAFRAVLAIVWIGFTTPAQTQNALEVWGAVPQLVPGIERPADENETKPAKKSAPKPDAESDTPEGANRP